MVDLEPDLETYWSGLKNAAHANRWWLMGLVALFVLGLVL